MKRKLLSLITLAAMVIGMIPAISVNAVDRDPFGPMDASVSEAYAAHTDDDGGATGFIATFTPFPNAWNSTLKSMTWTITPSDGSGAKEFKYTDSSGMPAISLSYGATAYVGLILTGLNDSGATAEVETTYKDPIEILY